MRSMKDETNLARKKSNRCLEIWGRGFLEFELQTWESIMKRWQRKH